MRPKNVSKNKLTEPKNDGKDEWLRFKGEDFEKNADFCGTLRHNEDQCIMDIGN